VNIHELKCLVKEWRESAKKASLQAGKLNQNSLMAEVLRTREATLLACARELEALDAAGFLEDR
jgi:hypothetical protein